MVSAGSCFYFIGWFIPIISVPRAIPFAHYGRLPALLSVYLFPCVLQMVCFTLGTCIFTPYEWCWASFFCFLPVPLRVLVSRSIRVALCTANHGLSILWGPHRNVSGRVPAGKGDEKSG